MLSFPLYGLAGSPATWLLVTIHFVVWVGFVRVEYSLHHFVPRFYLKRFVDADGLLWVYDKETDRVFSSTPRNLAAERGFYTLPDGFPDPLLLEQQFSELEEQAALITKDWLNQLASANSIHLPDTNREVMSLYLATQLLRTSEARTLLVQGLASREITTGEEKNPKSVAYWISLGQPTSERDFQLDSQLYLDVRDERDLETSLHI